MPFPKAIYDSRFGRFQRVEVRAVNEGAMFTLAPMPPRFWRALRRDHHGCSRCMGFGIVTDRGSGETVECPKCGGSDAWLDDKETRVEFLRKHVYGWEGVKLFEHGVPVGDLEFSPENLELVADADAEFLAILMTTLNLGIEIENSEGKVSTVSQSNVSGDTPIGKLS